MIRRVSGRSIRYHFDTLRIATYQTYRENALKSNPHLLALGIFGGIKDPSERCARTFSRVLDFFGFF